MIHVKRPLSCRARSHRLAHAISLIIGIMSCSVILGACGRQTVHHRNTQRTVQTPSAKKMDRQQKQQEQKAVKQQKKTSGIDNSKQAQKDRKELGFDSGKIN